MDAPFILSTMARRGLLRPGRPGRVARQLDALRRWGLSLAGEVRSAAARNPGRCAVVDERRSLTYRQLDEECRRLAHGLRGEYGVGPDQRVGILCRNSAAMLAAMIAVGELGADAVLLNTGVGPGQLEAVVQDQRVRVLVHDDEFFDLVGSVPPAVRRISADGDARRPSLAALIAGAPADDLAPPERPGRTIVLTSGTTGTPKGAQRPVPPGFGPLASLLSRIPVRAGERMFVAAPLFHTWGYAALQVALAVRGTAVLHRRFEPLPVLRTVVERDCGALFAVPVMLQRLLDVPPRSRPPKLPWRVVASSGSTLPGGLATRFMDAYGDALYNLYGSTETSHATIATPAELRRDPSCAGRPPHGTRVVILHPDGRPLPPGHTGRIFVGNDMLFEGYTDGGGKESYHGLLATGDLGHVTADGLLHVDGREDDMVISGGENVYPSAVEDLLAALPQVREVAVAGVPDPEYGQRLTTWIVLHRGERLEPEAVREYVRRDLTRFSVPRDVFFIPELPRNATGKVMLRSLLGPVSSPPASPAGSPAAARGPAPGAVAGHGGRPGRNSR